MQNHYNLIYREEEREMIPTLKVILAYAQSVLSPSHSSKHFGVGSIPWSPLARGALTRPLGVGERTIRADNDQWAISYLFNCRLTHLS